MKRYREAAAPSAFLAVPSFPFASSRIKLEQEFFGVRELGPAFTGERFALAARGVHRPSRRFTLKGGAWPPHSKADGHESF
jgi:hypothetical protein